MKMNSFGPGYCGALARAAIPLAFMITASGCVHRYARIIATSTPPLARVADARTREDYGTAPAFIDIGRRFVSFIPKRASKSLIFESLDCPSISETIIVSDWGKTVSTGRQHVTLVHATMQGCPRTATVDLAPGNSVPKQAGGEISPGDPTDAANRVADALHAGHP